MAKVTKKAEIAKKMLMTKKTLAAVGFATSRTSTMKWDLQTLLSNLEMTVSWMMN